MRTTLATILCIPVLFAAACGDPKVDPTIAQAVQTESKTEKAAEALAAKQQVERKAKAQAEQELEERRRSEIDAAARLPEPLPGDLESACDALTASYDEFMKRGSERDVLKWHDGRRKDLGKRRSSCIKVGSVEVAACEAEALAEDFPSLADVERTEAARMIMNRCVEKFGAS